MRSLDFIVILINIVMYSWTMYVLYVTTIIDISDIKQSIRDKYILSEYKHLRYIGWFFILGFIVDLLATNKEQLPTIIIGIVISCLLLPLYLKYIRYKDTKRFGSVPYLEYCRVCFDIYYICISYTLISVYRYIEKIFKRK